MGQLVCRPKRASGRESVLEPCVLLNFNPITEENHPQRLDEIDDSKEEAGREETRRKKKSWRWHSRRKTYNIVKAEKLYQSTVAITNWRRIDDLQGAPISSSEVVFTAEAQLEQEVLQPAVLDMPVSPSADDNTDSPVSLSGDGNVDTAVNSTSHNNIDSAASPTVYESFNSAESPTVYESFNSAESPTVYESFNSAESPTVYESFDSTESPTVYESFNSAESPTVYESFNSAESPTVYESFNSAESPTVYESFDSTESPTVYESFESAVSPAPENDIDCAANPKADEDIDSSMSSATDGNIDAAVCPKVDGDINCAGRPIEVPKNNCISRLYKFGEELGKGGFGSVHKGVRIKDGLKVAVKFVRKTSATKYISTPFYPEPLPLEIALTVIANRAPSCPNIIEVLDWQDDPDLYVMVMEHPSPSMDMQGFLKLNRGVLKEHKAQHIMRQVIHAVSVCCYRGVFHGDIKLTNLLINLNTLEVKLIDFGCGDLIRDSAYKSLRGTIPYISPEYYDTGKYHAKPATVFSLGVLLFTIVNGHYPTAQDQYDLINCVWSRFAVSRECCHFMQACLQRHPEDRLLLDHMHCHDWSLHKEMDTQLFNLFSQLCV